MRLNRNKLSAGRVPRSTREREVILDRVASLPGHFSADDLFLSLRRGRQRVSRATIYRTLDLLVGQGVLQRVHLGEEGAKYELIRGRPLHAHLYCLRCGRLEDYPLPVLEALPEQVRRRQGFQAEHLVLRICGYCRRCRPRGAAKTSFRNTSLPKRRS